MYLYKNRLLAESCNNMFSMNCDIRRYNTRIKNFLWLPCCGTNVRKSVISFQGPKLFNSLSTDIKTLLVYLHSLPNSKLFFWHN